MLMSTKIMINFIYELSLCGALILAVNFLLVWFGVIYSIVVGAYVVCVKLCVVELICLGFLLLVIRTRIFLRRIGPCLLFLVLVLLGVP